MKKTLYFLTIIVLSPAFAFGADCSQSPTTMNDIFVCFAFGNLSGLIPTLILVGLVTFMVGILRFVGAGDNQEKRQAGRSVMIWGIIVMFVMVSIWGFVNILTQSFFGKNFGLPNYLPELQKSK